MTNFEWLKFMDMDDFAEWIDIAVSGEVYDDMDDYTSWCCSTNYNDCSNRECSDCIKKWLASNHFKKMPELKNGTFVNVYVPDLSARQTGVIIDDNIIFETANPMTLEDNLENIMEIYDAKTFSECDAKHSIWERGK